MIGSGRVEAGQPHCICDFATLHFAAVDDLITREHDHNEHGHIFWFL